MKLHTLTIGTPSDIFEYNGRYGYQIELGDYEWNLECPGCNGWQECPEDHPISEEEELDDVHEFHGVLHTYRHSHGWTVAYPGCVALDQDNLGDFVRETLLTYGPGTYLVNDDWDDTECYFELVPREGQELPPEGWAQRQPKERVG